MRLHMVGDSEEPGPKAKAAPAKKAAKKKAAKKKAAVKKAKKR
jgi:hypothetical protein